MRVVWSSFFHLSAAPLSVEDDAAGPVVEDALAVELSATELPYILFSSVVVQIPLSMLLVFVNIAQVYISLRVGYLHLAHQPALDPLALVLFTAG